MKHINLSVVAVGAALLLLCAACGKETIKLNMTATLEQPTLDVDSTDGKNYLTNAEQWIYWESGDAIRISGDNPNAFTLTNGAGSRLGYFAGDVTVEKDGDELNAVYPSTSYSSDIVNENPCLVYPAEMPYRAVSSVQDPDRSFGQNCFPMVAHFKVDATNGSDIDFHSVSGMVRLHLYSSQTAKTISSIKFTSVARTGYTQRQLSGRFEIRDIDKNAPYLAQAFTTETDPYSITITGINKSVGSGKGNFLTFYLPLPAYFAGTAGGSSASANQTKYALQMTVTATDGSTFTKTFGADIRRNCITKMQALDITSWTAGTAVVGLVGCGTQDRPFQIYTLNELKQVRDAFNAAAAAGTTPTVNGITVTANTYFKVSRTDIVMNATDWTAGIKNFKGHFICSTSSPTDFGITNNSQYPLFESIASDGTVEYVSVKGTVSYTRSTTEAFSPFCITNNGTIDNCHVLCAVTSTASVAGLCVTNNGTISASALESSLTASNGNAHVGGLVLTNNGTMQGFNISTVKLTGSACGGMCYENKGLIENCIVATTANAATASSSNIGMIAYLNTAAATVKDCYVNGAFATTGSVGAVVYENKGRIDDCRTDLSVTSSVNAAGITVYQKGTAAEIRNCRTYRTATTMSATAAAAGIVCYLQGGTISNSYNRASQARTNNTTVTGGIVAVLGATGTTTDAITIQNVYNSVSGFFGTTASETINEVTTNNVQSGATTVTLTNCYNFASQDVLVNGTGVTRTVAKASNDGTTLSAALNGWASCDGTTYFHWTVATYPTLVDPSNPVTKRAYAQSRGSAARHGNAAARVAAARSHRR